MKKSLLCLNFFVVVWCLASSIIAQQPTATLTGVITDQTGAVIPNATVTAINKATNLSRTTVTNEEGVYVFAGLSVGNYEVKMSAQNFKTKITESAVGLSVGQTITLNGILGIGENVTEVDLIGEMPLVDTQTSKVDAVIESKEVENLPLNGRNFLELALLSPGNAPAPNFDPTKTNTVVISSAGGVFGSGGARAFQFAARFVF